MADEQKAETDAITEVTIEFTCPVCGADGYEESFDAGEMARATQVTVPCDDCSARIVLELDVRVGVETTVAPKDRAYPPEPPTAKGGDRG